MESHPATPVMDKETPTVVDHDIPVKNPDCGHRDCMRGCKSCIREFRSRTAAVPLARGNPAQMSDEDYRTPTSSSRAEANQTNAACSPSSDDHRAW